MLQLSNLRVSIELTHGQWSRLFYNKGTVLLGNYFDVLSSFSPKHYFTLNHADNFSAVGVEPIPIIFLPLAVLGLVIITKKKNLHFFSTVFLISIIVFLSGRKDFSFLMFPAITYVYLISIGYKNLKQKKAFKLIAIPYLLFLLARHV
ncbi:MAG: hypothetical protein AAB656_01725 [Patescibacteria group bacterium]